ncbi:MAG: AAA family ATPase, partial [Candidatus Methylomirabilis sp.]|nr:AAA family ATPase [Deltaproteobacteria bacterium]
AVNLAAGLAVAEKRTLLVDMDPQAKATSGAAGGRTAPPLDIYHALIGQAPMKDVIQETDLPLLHLAPATPDLAGAEIELVSEIARERRLANALTPILGDYDYVIVDCPPSLGLLTLNALSAAHTALIPIQAEFYPLEGLGHLLRTIELIQENVNPGLHVLGILATMVDPRSNLTQAVLQEVRTRFPRELLRTMIPRNVRLGEAPSHGKPICLYDVGCKGSLRYLRVVEEYLERTGSPVPGKGAAAAAEPPPEGL